MKKSQINKQKPTPTKAYLYYDDEFIYVNSDGQPAMFYIEYLGDYGNKFEPLLKNWTIRSKNNKLIMFTISTDNALNKLNESNKIISYTGSLKITAVEICDWNANKITAGIKKINLDTIENMNTELLRDNTIALKDYNKNYKKEPTINNKLRKKIINKSRIQK